MNMFFKKSRLKLAQKLRSLLTYTMRSLLLDKTSRLNSYFKLLLKKSAYSPLVSRIDANEIIIARGKRLINFSINVRSKNVCSVYPKIPSR